MNKQYRQSGFSLLEIIVVITIIGILATVAIVSFNESRQLARDKFRQASLQELQLAIALYKADNEEYPASGCGAADAEFAGPGPVNGVVANLVSCDDYIDGLVPKYISALPRDPLSEDEDNRGVYYRSDGTSYKLMFRNVAEIDLVSGFDHRFARCPSLQAVGQCSSSLSDTTYAVYSAGAEDW